MKESTKEKFWNIVRPMHSPVTRALRRRLGRNYQDHPEMELPPPYDAIQFDVERHLHSYLHLKPSEISSIVIVGASRAEEVDRIWRSYPQCSFLCFEPNPDTFQFLTQKFAGNPRVALAKLALSAEPGKATFYEMSMHGNGSLLEPDAESWALTNQREDKSVKQFDVQLSTLDLETKHLPAIDLIWMDVQGAEGQVFSGGTETLKRAKAIFVEVALVYSPYKGSELFPQLLARLAPFGFTCVGLGLDARVGNGNALFVRNYEQLVPH